MFSTGRSIPEQSIYGARKPTPAWWWRGAMTALGTSSVIVPMVIGGLTARWVGDRAGLVALAVSLIGAVWLAVAARRRLLVMLRERAAPRETHEGV